MIVPVPVGPATAQELTVYNQGMALVKEVRRVPVAAGRSQVAIEDVAASIDPTSVALIPKGNAFTVLEQNYQYDLIGVNKILEKSIGKRVRLVRTIGNTRDVVEGILLSAPTSVINPNGDGPNYQYNGLVIKADDGRIILSPEGEISVETLPEGLISKPTLVWDIQSDKAGDVPVDLSYITQNISWTADYVLTLMPGNTADLQGWVTMNNQSGATYRDAKLKLLAGDVNVVQNQPRVRKDLMRAAAPTMAAEAGFAEESLFEYHLYTLQRPATIRDRETKQLALLDGQNVPVERRLVVQFNRFDTYMRGGGTDTVELKPDVFVDFKNDKASNLGMPLPAGRFRVYTRDKSGSTQLLGEAQITHTPRDEKVSLPVGQAFDVRATRTRTDFKPLSNNSSQSSYTYELRNRKDEPTTVDVIEYVPGTWKITGNTQDYVKLDATRIMFRVPLKASETKKVSFTVTTKW